MTTPKFARELAELRARLAQQAEMVEKCMVAMNENADRGMKAEQERDDLRAELAKSQPVEQGKPVGWFMPVNDINGDECFVQVDEPDPEISFPLFRHPVRPMTQAQRRLLLDKLGAEWEGANGDCWDNVVIDAIEAFHDIKGATE